VYAVINYNLVEKKMIFFSVWSERRTTATGLMMLLLRLHIDLLAGAWNAVNWQTAKTAYSFQILAANS